MILLPDMGIGRLWRRRRRRKKIRPPSWLGREETRKKERKLDYAISCMGGGRKEGREGIMQSMRREGGRRDGGGGEKRRKEMVLAKRERERGNGMKGKKGRERTIFSLLSPPDSGSTDTSTGIATIFSINYLIKVLLLQLE